MKSRIYQVINEETGKIVKKTASRDVAIKKANKVHMGKRGLVETKVLVDGAVYYDPSPLSQSEGFYMEDCYNASGLEDLEPEAEAFEEEAEEE